MEDNLTIKKPRRECQSEKLIYVQRTNFLYNKKVFSKYFRKFVNIKKQKELIINNSMIISSLPRSDTFYSLKGKFWDVGVEKNR